MKHAIETFELEHDFGLEPILQNLSLQIPRGSIYALLGRNGSGKTTLIRVLLGMLRPRRGRAEVLGFNPFREAIEVRTQVGYVPQDCDFDPEMTVSQTLRFVGSFYPGRWREDEVLALQQRFDLDPAKKVKELSGGQKGQLALTVALGSDPDLLILDEPTAALDPVIRRSVQAAVIDFMSQGERTVVMASHQLNEVERLADHVAIVDGGRLVCEDPLDALKDRVARVKARFSQPPVPSQIPGLISYQSQDGVLHMSAWVEGEAGREDLAQVLEGLGAEPLHFEASDLESIFVDLVGGRTHA